MNQQLSSREKKSTNQPSTQSFDPKAKLLSASVSSELTTAVADNKVSELAALKTKGGGDCAFHAVLGVWDDNEQQVICAEAKQRRAEVKRAIEDSKAGSRICELAAAGIKELIMVGRAVGEKSRQLLQRYQQFLTDQNALSPQLWQAFELELRKHTHVVDHIASLHQHPKGATASLREQFYDALNRKDSELYAIIRSLTDLCAAFKHYNDLAQTAYDWEGAVSSEVIAEYAQFVGRPEQWLLPSEIALLAEVFRITVEYYSAPGAKVEVFNPNQKNKVVVQFNGSDHFEQIKQKGKPSLSLPQTNKGGSSTPPAILDEESTAPLILPKQEDKATVVNLFSDIHREPEERKRQLPRYPKLHEALRRRYRKCDSVPLPLRQDSAFPIQAVSLVISDKNTLDPQDLEQKIAYEKKEGEQKAHVNIARTRTTAGEKADFWSPRFRVEEGWHQTQQPISLQDIFTSSNHGESAAKVRRVLVEGRAGVGKSTFSQCVAYHWAEKLSFIPEADCVFWIPLREWLKKDLPAKGAASDFVSHLAHFIYQHLELEKDRQCVVSEQEIRTVLSGQSNECTLLILDGYDEVASIFEVPSHPYHKLLQEALRFPFVLVTTRDYQLPIQYNLSFDRQLVNVGFTDKQISEYLKTYAECYFKRLPQVSPIKTKTEEKKEDEKLTKAILDPASVLPQKIEQALRQNPRIWSLAHTPLTLALICDLWFSKHKDKSLTALPYQNLTTLYQDIVLYYIKVCAEKPGQEQESSMEDFNTAKQAYFLELDILSTLAWQTFRAEDDKHKQQELYITLTPQAKKEALSCLQARYSDPQKVSSCIGRVFELGFLRLQGQKNTSYLYESHEFVHLTFHEWFAAYYVLNSLQGYRGEQAYEDTLQWLKDNKYQPRYAVMLGFLAGLTVDPAYQQAFQGFWHALLSPAHDTIGFSHVSLILRCLEEANYNKRIPDLEILQTQIDQFAVRQLKNYYRLLSPSSDWLWSLFGRYPQALSHTKEFKKLLLNVDFRPASLRALRGIGGTILQDIAVHDQLLTWLSSQDENTKADAVMALHGMAETVLQHRVIKDKLLHLLSERSDNVRKKVAVILQAINGYILQDRLLRGGLLTLLMDSNSKVQIAAVSILQGMSASILFDEEFSERILALLNSENITVKTKVIEVLQSMNKVSLQDEAVRTKLLAKLVGLGADIQLAKMVMLERTDGNIFQEPIRSNLLELLGDLDMGVCAKTVQLLQNKGEVILQHEPIRTKLVELLSSPNTEVRSAVARVMRELGESILKDESICTKLLRSLTDPNPNIRATAVQILQEKGAVILQHESIRTPLVELLNNSSPDVRSAATAVLRGVGEGVLRDEAIRTELLHLLKDNTGNVRATVLGLLKRIATAALQDKDIRRIVLELLNSSNMQIRLDVIRVLKGMGENILIDEAMQTKLLTLLADPSPEVSGTAKQVLLQIGVVPVLNEYFKQEEQRQTKSSVKMKLFAKVLPNAYKNPWLPVLPDLIIQSTTSIIIHGKTIQVTSTYASTFIEAPFPLTKPLIEKLAQACTEQGLPYHPFKIRGSSKKLYPTATKPKFKPATPPILTLMPTIGPAEHRDSKEKGLGGRVQRLEQRLNMDSDAESERNKINASEELRQYYGIICEISWFFASAQSACGKQVSIKTDSRDTAIGFSAAGVSSIPGVPIVPGASLAIALFKESTLKKNKGRKFKKIKPLAEWEPDPSQAAYLAERFARRLTLERSHLLQPSTAGSQTSDWRERFTKKLASAFETAKNTFEYGSGALRDTYSDAEKLALLDLLAVVKAIEEEEITPSKDVNMDVRLNKNVQQMIEFVTSRDAKLSSPPSSPSLQKVPVGQELDRKKEKKAMELEEEWFWSKDVEENEEEIVTFHPSPVPTPSSPIVTSPSSRPEATSLVSPSQQVLASPTASPGHGFGAMFSQPKAPGSETQPSESTPAQLSTEIVTTDHLVESSGRTYSVKK